MHANMRARRHARARARAHAAQVRVFAAHPQGVVTVRFKTEEAAAGCIALMHQRFFDGRRIEAAMWDGFTSFHSVSAAGGGVCGVVWRGAARLTRVCRWLQCGVHGAATVLRACCASAATNVTTALLSAQ
jgi:hypothetical protein